MCSLLCVIYTSIKLLIFKWYTEAEWASLGESLDAVVGVNYSWLRHQGFFMKWNINKNTNSSTTGTNLLKHCIVHLLNEETTTWAYSEHYTPTWPHFPRFSSTCLFLLHIAATRTAITQLKNCSFVQWLIADYLSWLRLWIRA